jgi:Zn-dependent M28 family amino/carboxypeptidase
MILMPGTSYRGDLPPADEALLSLAAELRQDVKRLAVDIGERNVRYRPKQLAQAADLIEARFTAAGCAVTRQEYKVGDTSCCNLEVEVIGTAHPGEIVLVGAHYDTVPGTPGANDNTSGIAATLALARRLAGGKTERTLRFVAFVNEEKPYAHTKLMGSRVYARRCRERGEKVTAMLSLETIGYYDDTPGSQKYPPPLGLLYPSTGNFVAFVGNMASRDLVRRVVGTFRTHEQFPSEGGAFPALVPRIGDSDHASFWKEGYKALMVTDTVNFRYPYYHTPEDTIDKIDFERLARVVRGLAKVVEELA